MKSQMHDPAAPFGVDLLLPAVGGNARATNYDYTKGQLGQLIDVVIEEKARLFVTAVGVPPSWVVEKLHENGILVMNMVGSPKHCKKALDVGVDGVVAQGSEAGGHTGDVATFPLIPQCVDLVAGRTSTLTGGAFGKRTACTQPHTHGAALPPPRATALARKQGSSACRTLAHGATDPLPPHLHTHPCAACRSHPQPPPDPRHGWWCFHGACVLGMGTWRGPATPCHAAPTKPRPWERPRATRACANRSGVRHRGGRYL